MATVSSRSRRRQRLVLPWAAILDFLVLLLWGLMLLRFWLTGKLAILLHPDYAWLSHSATVLLLGMAAMRGVQILRSLTQGSRGPTAATGHIALLPRQVSSLLLLSVAIFGLIYVPRPFTSDTALQRGITDSLGQTRSQPQRFVRQQDASDRSIIDWIRTLNAYPEPDAYSGQAANVTGFVIHPPDWPDTYFMVSRFVLTCCAADAYPVGLPVRMAAGQARPPVDSWQAVKGTMTTDTLADRRQLVITPTEITTIPEPQNPYEF